MMKAKTIYLLMCAICLSMSFLLSLVGLVTLLERPENYVGEHFMVGTGSFVYMGTTYFLGLRMLRRDSMTRLEWLESRRK